MACQAGGPVGDGWLIVASIERRALRQRDSAGRVRTVVRYKVRYRDHAGHEHSETMRRLVDAERRKAELEVQLASGSWRDPRRGELRLSAWAQEWVTTRHDLRASTRARLEMSMSGQVLPRFGTTPLVKISNADIRRWVADMLEADLSPTTVRKAVFAVRQCMSAAVADGRLLTNPAVDIPLPSERLKPPRFLSQAEVERLADAVSDRYRALVLVGAFAGLRWGEAAGLTRTNVDVLRSRIRVVNTAVEVRGHVTLGNEPKTRRSKRTVPVARSVMRELEQHLAQFVMPDSDALVFTAPQGGPLRRSLFARRVWAPAVKRAGLDSITFHGLRHSFVAILVDAGCNVREVSEWAGHNNVAFTLTRYGGLFEDGADEAVDRLDALLGRADEPAAAVVQLRGGES